MDINLIHFFKNVSGFVANIMQLIRFSYKITLENKKDL